MLSTQLKFRNKINVKALIPAAFVAFVAMPAMASDQYSDRGRVLSVTPQTERINVPRQECRTEYQQQTSYEPQYNNGDRSYTGSILGGIAGGLLGSTIGKGSGRVAAAAVGAGIGAVAGDRIGNRPNNTVTTTRTVPVQNCYQVENWQTVNAGYLVTYEYNGRTYNTVTNQHPGQFVDVNVAVSPANVLSNHQALPQTNYIENIQYQDWQAPRDIARPYHDRGYRAGHGRDHKRQHRDYY